MSGFRFFFYSNERNEPPHIHVESGDGAAKFWLTPVAFAGSVGYDAAEVRELLSLVSQHRDELERKWHEHFGG